MFSTVIFFPDKYLARNASETGNLEEIKMCLEVDYRFGTGVKIHAKSVSEVFFLAGQVVRSESCQDRKFGKTKRKSEV